MINNKIILLLIMNTIEYPEEIYPSYNPRYSISVSINPEEYDQQNPAFFAPRYSITSTEFDSSIYTSNINHKKKVVTFKLFIFLFVLILLLTIVSLLSIRSVK